jgi:sialic acid synthase SpsE
MDTPVQAQSTSPPAPAAPPAPEPRARAPRGSTLKIDGRDIAPGEPTFVIAEIGVNHDGNVNKALELVRVAANCGADAVKLQVFRAVNLLHPTCSMAEYQKQRSPTADVFEMLRRYEMTGEEITRVVRAIRDKKMVPLATPFSPSDLDLIERLRLPAVKIASPDLVNRPLLSAAQKLGKPLIVSTGAATMGEVDEAVGWLRGWGTSFALLHCVSGYPTPPQHANLCWIDELSRRFNVPVGYSDHTIGISTGALAAAAGALIVEKHLTYDRDARGPDHAASSDPNQFERYVKHLREADTLRGCPGKQVLDVELDVLKSSRQSLVLRRTIQPGEAIREQDLTVQRPGTGLPASMIDRAVGRKAARPIPAGSLLQWDMLADAA